MCSVGWQGAHTERHGPQGRRASCTSWNRSASGKGVKHLWVSSRLGGEAAAWVAASCPWLSHARVAAKFSEVAQIASDAPPPSAQGCWLSRSAAPQGGRRARQHRIQALAPSARSVRDRCQLRCRGVIVTVRLRRRRRVCGECGQTGRHLQIHDRRVKRWRHLDLGASRCVVECELRRLRCRSCGVHLEPVPWARPGAAHTRDFEDVVAWLAQQMAFAPITRLLRVGWHSIGPIVARVVADHLDERRLAGLVCIGVDEISYRRHHRYLTTVADHATGAIVWCQPGRNSATLQAFFEELGDAKTSIRAVSIDMSGEYQRAIRAAVPDAEIAFDPFHVVRLAASATDQVRRDEWNEHDRSHTPHGRWVKSTRWSLLKAPEHQTIGQLATLWEVQQANRRLYRV